MMDQVRPRHRDMRSTGLADQIHPEHSDLPKIISRYGDLQLLSIPIHWWKDLSMDFVTGLPISTNWKVEKYDSILVIIDWLTKIVYYKPVKVTINTLSLMKVIFDVRVRHYNQSDLIESNCGAVFTLKFWSSACYFLGIKQRLSTIFHPQINGQIKKQKSTIKAYLRIFINFK